MKDGPVLEVCLAEARLAAESSAPRNHVSEVNKNEPPGSMEVLVVEDEPLIRWSLRRGFATRGHHVSEAADGAGALRLLSVDPGRFHAVVLDYRLPDSSDLALLEKIRRLAPLAAVVMMTAYGDQAMRVGASSLGARTVVNKPFDVQALVSLVERTAT
jgi:DNA-binding NtrC family response regulator